LSCKVKKQRNRTNYEKIILLFCVAEKKNEEKRISTFFGFGPVKFKPKNMRREKKDSMDCFFLFFSKKK
jgi:hypothetical protein